MKYLLPKELGGMEWDSVGETDVYARFVVPGHESFGNFSIPLALLTPVAPPIPEEPPVWSVVSCYDGENPWTFQREPVDGKYFWFTTGQERSFSWEEVCAKGNPVLLTPEPPRVELPWTGESATGGRIAVELDSDPDEDHPVRVVFRGSPPRFIAPDVAREMAAALLSAAGGAS